MSKLKILFLTLLTCIMFLSFTACKPKPDNNESLKLYYYETPIKVSYEDLEFGSKIFKSKIELDYYVLKNKDKYLFELNGLGFDDNKTFQNDIKKYDDKFFKKNSLALYTCMETTTSYKFKFKNSTILKNKIILQLEKYSETMFGTYAYVFYHILIEVPDRDKIISGVEFEILS